MVSYYTSIAGDYFALDNQQRGGVKIDTRPVKKEEEKTKKNFTHVELPAGKSLCFLLVKSSLRCGRFGRLDGITDLNERRQREKKLSLFDHFMQSDSNTHEPAVYMWTQTHGDF